MLLPGDDDSDTEPPMDSMLERTTSMPTPRPETFVTLLRGGEAGREDEVVDFVIAHLRDFVLAGQPQGGGLLPDAVDVQAACRRR